MARRPSSEGPKATSGFSTFWGSGGRWRRHTRPSCARNHVDEVGLAWSVLTLLTEAPVVARALGSRYTHAFVDDLHQGSSDEALVLEALGRHIAHITVAVDDDASPRIWDPVDAATLRW